MASRHFTLIFSLVIFPVFFLSSCGKRKKPMPSKVQMKELDLTNESTKVPAGGQNIIGEIFDPKYTQVYTKVFWYHGEPYFGDVVEYYEGSDSSVFFTGSMISGKEAGDWIAYYKSGAPMAKATYESGNADGWFYKFSEQGDTLVELFAHGSLWEIRTRDWYNYPEHVLNGHADWIDAEFNKLQWPDVLRFYRFSGADSIPVRFVHKRDTVWQYTNDTIRRTVLNKHGDCRTQELYIGEQLVAHDEYTDDGASCNTSMAWYRNGKLKHKKIYDAKGTELSQEEYYENGRLKRKSREGEDGFYTSWYPNGRMEESWKGSEDCIIGKKKLFDENGKLKEEKEYKDCNWVCTRHYDETGKLIGMESAEMNSVSEEEPDSVTEESY